MNWQRICPEFLKKRLFRHLLHHFVGSFFKEKLSLDQLGINFYQGTASVEDLHLDCDYINEKLTNTISTLPVEIISGFVGSVCVYIPWHDITNQDCILTLKNIQIILKIKNLKNNTNITNTSLIESVLEKTTSLTDSIMNESIHLAQEYVQNETDFNTNESFFIGFEAFSSMITSILSRVKIKLENVNIRIEPSINLNKNIALEIQISLIDYLDKDSSTRLFKINNAKIILDESSNSNNLDESIINTNPIEIIQFLDESLIYLKINKQEAPLIELTTEIGSIESNLTVNQITCLIELLSDLNGNYELIETEHNLSSSQNDIYYSFISNDSESRRNSIRTDQSSTSSVVIDEFKQKLNSIEQIFRLYVFTFKLNRLDLKLESLRIIFDTVNVVLNQKDNKSQSINELIVTFNKINLTENAFVILNTFQSIRVEFESLMTKENFKKYENFLIEINEKIQVNLNENNLKKMLNLINRMRQIKKYAKNECIKSKDFIFNESIEITFELNNQNFLLINLIDLHVNKFNDLNVKLSQMNLSFKNTTYPQFKQFLQLKQLNLTFENNSDEISVVKFKRIDSSSAQINLDTGIEEYSPFSQVNSLISNESNTQIVCAGNRLEIEEFINQSLKHSNNSIQIRINDAQFLVYDQMFLACLVSSLKSSSLTNTKTKSIYLIKTTLLLNIKTIAMKAYLHHNLDYTEFYSDLNSINLCYNCLFRTQQISLQVNQINLVYLNRMTHPDYSFPLLNANNSSLLIDFNNYFKDVNNSMITLAVKVKPSKLLFALNLDYLKLMHKFSKDQNTIWLNEFILMFSLIETNKSLIQNEIHLHLSNSCIEYKPIYLDIKSTLSLKSFHFTKSTSSEFSSILIEDIKLFLAKNYFNICVAELDLFELNLKMKEKIFQLTSNLIQFKTCIDSAQDLIRLIKYVCNNGDYTVNEPISETKTIETLNQEENFEDTSSDDETLLSEYNLIETEHLINDSILLEEFEIKNLTQRPMINIIDDYFNKPDSFDLFKPPATRYPTSNETFLVEISIKWNLYKGNDFQTNKSRDSNEFMQISLNKFKLRLDMFPLESRFLYRCSMGINEIKIRDNLSSSSYDMFMYRHESDVSPRRSMSPMCFVKFVCYNSLDILDCECKLSIQPLRFNFDQDTLIFLYNFLTVLIAELTPAKSLNESNSKLSFNFRKFIFSSDLIVKFNFNGKYDSKNYVSHLNRLLLPAVQLSNTEIIFKKIFLKQIKSDNLILKLKQYWLNDIKQSQVMNLIKGWSLFNSVILVVDGFICLVAYPMQHYNRNGRLIYGIQKSSSTFSACTVLATMESTSNLISSSKSIADYFYNLITFNTNKNSKSKSKEGVISNLTQVAQNLINELNQNVAIRKYNGVF